MDGHQVAMDGEGAYPSSHPPPFHDASASASAAAEPADGVTQPATALSRANSRSQAIAKLRRAASQRELRRENSARSRSGSVSRAASRAQTPDANGGGTDAPGYQDWDEAASAAQQSSFLQLSGATTPSDPGAPSPIPGSLGSPGTPFPPGRVSPYPISRSPLPSLEALQAQFQAKQASAGLGRSNSASAANQAARAYALEKLMGGSAAAEFEEAITRGEMLPPLTAPFPGIGGFGATTLGRSHTISGAFGGAVSSRGRRRGFTLGGEDSMAAAELGDKQAASPDEAAQEVSTDPRTVARSAMIRKLSGRGRGAGGARQGQAVDADRQEDTGGERSEDALSPSLGDDANYHREASTSQRSQLPAIATSGFASSSPSFSTSRLRRRSSTSSIPNSASSYQSSSPHHAATGSLSATSNGSRRHTMERDRDSAMARLVGEDNFEYEKLLREREKDAGAAWSGVGTGSPGSSSATSSAYPSHSFRGKVTKEGRARRSRSPHSSDDRSDGRPTYTAGEHWEAQLERRRLQHAEESSSSPESRFRPLPRQSSHAQGRRRGEDEEEGDAESSARSSLLSDEPEQSGRVTQYESEQVRRWPTGLGIETHLRQPSGASTICDVPAVNVDVSPATHVGDAQGHDEQATPVVNPFPQLSPSNLSPQSASFSAKNAASARIHELLGSDFIAEFGPMGPSAPSSRRASIMSRRSVGASTVGGGATSDAESLSDWDVAGSDNEGGEELDEGYLAKVDKIAGKLHRLARQRRLSPPNGSAKVKDRAKSREGEAPPPMPEPRDARISPRAPATPEFASTPSGSGKARQVESPRVDAPPVLGYKVEETEEPWNASIERELPAHEETLVLAAPPAGNAGHRRQHTLSDVFPPLAPEPHLPPATANELVAMYSNDKLMPFPGLFKPTEQQGLPTSAAVAQVGTSATADGTDRPESHPNKSSSTSASIRRPSVFAHLLKRKDSQVDRKSPVPSPRVADPNAHSGEGDPRGAVRLSNKLSAASLSRTNSHGTMGASTDTSLSSRHLADDTAQRLSRNSSFSGLSRMSSSRSAQSVSESIGSTSAQTPLENEHAFTPATAQILQRFNSAVGQQLLPGGAKRASMASAVEGLPGLGGLSDPPRRLLFHSAVVQVVNANTIKDRYLFLFNDILVIAKPLWDDVEGASQEVEPAPPTLGGRFLVKSVVELHQLRLSVPKDDDPSPIKKEHPITTAFIQEFEVDPGQAVGSIIDKAGLPNDPVMIARLFFQTPELHRGQLVNYLVAPGNEVLLAAYLGRFRFISVSILDALRSFLLTIRFPTALPPFEKLLKAFVSRWHDANAPLLPRSFTLDLTERLVWAMMELNDFLHSNIEDSASMVTFGLPNPHISSDDFVIASRGRDPEGAVRDDQLADMYASIRRDPLAQAPPPHATNRLVQAVIEPPLPNKLTYGMPQSFTISLPRPVNLLVKLIGYGVTFEPRILDFSQNERQTFQMFSTNLGPRSVLFVRIGAHSPAIAGIPTIKTFTVERAFMRYSFNLAFTNHLGSKRKYMFSLDSAQSRKQWVQALKDRIEREIETRKQQADPASVTNGVSLKARRAAEAIALQVLRDALIAPEEQPSVGLSKDRRPAPRRPGQSPATASGEKDSRSAALARGQSVSRRYYASTGAGRLEKDLMHQGQDPISAQPSSGKNYSSRPSIAYPEPPPQPSTAAGPTVGQDIVVTCQQNSLLPLVLQFLQTGLDPDKLVEGMAATTAPSQAAVGPGPAPAAETPKRTMAGNFI